MEILAHCYSYSCEKQVDQQVCTDPNSQTYEFVVQSRIK